MTTNVYRTHTLFRRFAFEAESGEVRATARRTSMPARYKLHLNDSEEAYVANKLVFSSKWVVMDESLKRLVEVQKKWGLFKRVYEFEYSGHKFFIKRPNMSQRTFDFFNRDELYLGSIHSSGFFGKTWTIDLPEQIPEWLQYSLLTVCLLMFDGRKKF
jgi:hypothetical protein